jgi:hypothetical protein
MKSPCSILYFSNKNKRQKEKGLPFAFPVPTHAARLTILLAAAAIGVQRAIRNRLVYNDITITDLNIVQARGVGTNPRLVLDRSSLSAEIRKRNQITFTALATPWKCILHEIASFLLYKRIVFTHLTTQVCQGLAKKLAEGEPPPLHPRPRSKIHTHSPLSYHKLRLVSAPR